MRTDQLGDTDDDVIKTRMTLADMHFEANYYREALTSSQVLIEDLSIARGNCDTDVLYRRKQQAA
ncbi:hypothetical protein [Nocardia aurantia]|uniref:hypothetical protein n=1 Tax=Nocardia aurantia TaxID=2585199 RepID=UPI001885E437|nr:hypothetical protein [Nocardia aurantia]